MATLQKFKLLATQCAVVGSPTRSPTTSPVIHIRRRKTLRMLLGRAGNGSVFHRRFLQHHRREDSPDRQKIHDNKPSATGKESLGVRLKLKDLFVSSPPPPPPQQEEEDSQRLLSATGRSGDGGGQSGLVMARRVGGGGSLRPLSATFRQRLLMRRAWRPVLVAIPEHSP